MHGFPILFYIAHRCIFYNNLDTNILSINYDSVANYFEIFPTWYLYVSEFKIKILMTILCIYVVPYSYSDFYSTTKIHIVSFKFKNNV